MTTGNAPKMTLEEKIVQTLKDEKLYALLGDEDAITELVKRAIHEALYQPQRVPKSYGGWDQKDSIVVETARTIAASGAAQIMKVLVDEILANQSIKKLLNDAIATALPQVLSTYLAGAIGAFSFNQSQETINKVRDAIQNRSI